MINRRSRSPVLMTVSPENRFINRIRSHFDDAEYELITCHDRDEAMANANRRAPDIVLVDVESLGSGGYDLCSELRSNTTTKDVLIAIASQVSDETSELNGFVNGADDFICKSYSTRLISARFEAMLRRKGTTNRLADRVLCRGIELDRVGQRVSIDGQPLELTRTEFLLLAAMMSSPNRVFRREELIDATHRPGVIVLARTIDVHIRSLRIKLGPSADAIETVRGVGYRFCDST